MTRALAALEREGLATHHRSCGDGREMLAEPTDKGLQLLERT